MKEAELADGTILEFPDETDDAVIAATVKKIVSGNNVPAAPIAPSAPAKKDGFISDVKSNVKNRLSQIQEIEQAQKAGQQGAVESGFQKAGTAAGLLTDVVGSAVGNVAKAGYEALPASAQEPIKKIGSAVIDNPFVKAGLQKTQQELSEFKKNNPRAYRNLGSAVNLAAVISPKPAAPKQSMVAKAGEGLEKMANKSQMKAKVKFAENLTAPLQTKDVLEKQVKNSTVSKFGTVKPKLSNFEKSVAKEVAKVEGVKKGNILQKNYNAISDAVRKEADVLQKTLDANDVPLTAQDFQDTANKIVKKLKTHPNLNGDTIKSAQNILQEYSKIIMSRPRTAANMLRARKDLDKYIADLEYGGEAIESAKKVAARVIRQESNDLVASKIKNVDVKASLDRQHKLLSGMENIQPKAAAQAKTPIGRVGQAVSNAAGSKSKAGQAATLLVGAAGATVVAKAAPVLVGLGLGAYMVKKGTGYALSSDGVKALGRLLKSNDSDIVRSISPNRALLLDIVNNATTEEQQKPEQPK